MDATQFIAALTRGKPGAAYFLRGPDRFLHEECRRAVGRSLPEEARAWCLAEIEFEGGRLRRELEAAHQMPMLGGHSYYFFSDAEDFKHASDEDYEALQAYLEKPSAFSTVIFAAAEPDRRRRFVQLLEKKTAVVEMTPLGRREAASWLQHYARQSGVEIEATLADEIAGRFESHPDSRGSGSYSAGTREGGGVNLLWMRTEVEKLLTARPEAKRLERTDLELIVSVREEHEIGRLLQALAARKFEKALEHLRALFAGKESEMLILWSIGDLFRQAVRSLSPGGAAKGNWYRASNPFSTFEIARQAARTYSRHELLLALRLIRAADLAVKSSWKDSRILLEFLIWQIVSGAAGETLPAFELSAPAEA